MCVTKLMAADEADNISGRVARRSRMAERALGGKMTTMQRQVIPIMFDEAMKRGAYGVECFASKSGWLRVRTCLRPSDAPYLSRKREAVVEDAPQAEATCDGGSFEVKLKRDADASVRRSVRVQEAETPSAPSAAAPTPKPKRAPKPKPKPKPPTVDKNALSARTDGGKDGGKGKGGGDGDGVVTTKSYSEAVVSKGSRPRPSSSRSPPDSPPHKSPRGSGVASEASDSEMGGYSPDPLKEFYSDEDPRYGGYSGSDG